MKLLVIAVVLAVASSTVKSNSFQMTEEQSKSMLKTFMLTIMRSSYGLDFTCAQCETVNKEAIQIISAFFLTWKPIGKKICEYITKKSSLTQLGCMTLLESYIPIIEKSFTKLFIINKGFLCSFSRKGPAGCGRFLVSAKHCCPRHCRAN